MDDLRPLVRKTIKAIDDAGVICSEIKRLLSEIRIILKERGLDTSCRIGEEIEDGSKECIEWYAGQLLDIVETKQFFAMNSLIGSLDRFCPSDISRDNGSQYIKVWKK